MELEYDYIGHDNPLNEDIENEQVPNCLATNAANNFGEVAGGIVSGAAIAVGTVAALAKLAVENGIMSETSVSVAMTNILGALSEVAHQAAFLAILAASNAGFQLSGTILASVVGAFAPVLLGGAALIFLGYFLTGLVKYASLMSNFWSQFCRAVKEAKYHVDNDGHWEYPEEGEPYFVYDHEGAVITMKLQVDTTMRFRTYEIDLFRGNKNVMRSKDQMNIDFDEMDNNVNVSIVLQQAPQIRYY